LPPNDDDDAASGGSRKEWRVTDTTAQPDIGTEQTLTSAAVSRCRQWKRALDEREGSSTIGEDRITQRETAADLRGKIADRTRDRF
jgi:hypothetical protein